MPVNEFEFEDVDETKCPFPDCGGRNLTLLNDISQTRNHKGDLVSVSKYRCQGCGRKYTVTRHL